MPTGNKRVSQLVELTSGEVALDDSFLIIDATARESKRIKASELNIWLQDNGGISTLAYTASYVAGGNVDGSVSSSSYSNTSISSSFSQTSLDSISSSYSLTASFALNGGSLSSDTASYLSYSGVPNGTSSYSMNSAVSDVSAATSYLLYSGGNNGTASYAITTENVNHSTTADTASYFNNFDSGSTVSTASYALFAQTVGSTISSDSSSYLIFSPNNGTASYAMAAQSFANVISGQGIFLANTQSTNIAQLDNVDVLWSTTTNARTPIDAVGTITIPFTSSIETAAVLYLGVLDRNTGIQTTLDSTPISLFVSPTMGSWGGYNSGSIKQTFSLMGQGNLYGSYLVFVSSSNNISIDSSRTVRFNVSSESDDVSSYVNSPIEFSSTPLGDAIFIFTSDDGGPFGDVDSGIVASASLGKEIYTLDANNQFFTSINYFWTLNNVTASNFSDNILLSSIIGIPTSLTYLSCSNCNLSSFYTFESSSLEVFDCHSNSITELPKFPTSMSYIDCSSNDLTNLNLPVTLSYLNCSDNSINSFAQDLPYGLNTLLMDDNSMTSFFPSATDSIISMSLNNNSLSSISLPTSLSYLSINNNLISILSTLPTGVSYLSLQSCSLLSFAIDNMTSDLISNGQINGTVDVRGNGTLSLTSISNMTVLNSSGWTTLYDV